MLYWSVPVLFKPWPGGRHVRGRAWGTSSSLHKEQQQHSRGSEGLGSRHRRGRGKPVLEDSGVLTHSGDFPEDI